MTIEMIFVLAMTIIMLVLLAFEVARADLIVFSFTTIFLMTGVITTADAIKGFSNEGMLTIALLFIIAGTIQKHGLIEKVISNLMDKNKNSKFKIIRMFLPISLASGFLNNTPLVVTLTPIIKDWCLRNGYYPSKFLIPLSYMTILGGTLTVIGTSTNLVVHGLLLDSGKSGFSFFEFITVGIPITIIGLIYFSTIGYKLLPNNVGITEKVSNETKEFLISMNVDEEYQFIGKTIDEAGLRDLKGLFLLEIIRGKKIISPVRKTTIIEEKDLLIFTGDVSTIVDLQKVKGLNLKTNNYLALTDLENSKNKLIEIVVSHQSYLLSKTIKDSGFRSKYNAGIVAVHRHNERIKSKIGDILLRPGDTLLLLAGDDFLQHNQYSTDFYIVSLQENKLNKKRKKTMPLISLSIFLSMIILVTFGVLSMFKAMLYTVLLYLIFKITNINEAKNYMQFNVLLLIASAFGIGAAMTNSGLASYLANQLLVIAQPLGLFSIIILLFFLTNLFTEFITNSAAAVIMFPVAIEMASSLDIHYMGLVIAITLAASASFLTPIGYQTNLIVYGPGGYKFMDYIRVGLPLTVIVMFVSSSIIYYVWY